MKNKELAVADTIELLGDEPLALAGEGKALRGYMRVNNPGTDPVNLREVILRLQPLGTDRLAMFGHTSLSLVLQPDQTARVRLSFDYDPLTPPGEYHGALEVNGITHPVTAYLAEIVRLMISPASVVIDQASGTVKRQVVFGNEGNVPLTIHQPGRIELGKELLLRRGASVTLAAAGEKSTGALDKLFAEFVRDESRAAFSEAGRLDVHFKGGNLTLQPGEVKAVEMDIHMPEKLVGGARYIARAPFYTSDMEFILVPPSGGPVRQPRPRGNPEQ